MARADAFGFFWDDRPPPAPPKKEREKLVPPKPTWLDANYLPGFEEAKAFNIQLATWNELVDAKLDRTPFMFDIESYPNYFICSFRSYTTGNVIYFESSETASFDPDGLRWCLENLLIVGFNSLKYDIIVATLAACGCTVRELYAATVDIIELGLWSGQIYKKYGGTKLKTDHIDLIEVAPLSANLKIYGSRVHTPIVQDLPFKPGTWLTQDQITCMRWYNIQSDLSATAFLFRTLEPHLQMRVEMSERYNIDLRSKSDAQIAEAVIRSEYRKKTGLRPQVPTVEVGKTFRYQVPNYISFVNPVLQQMLEELRVTDFVVSENGKVGLPKNISRVIEINGTKYKMGIGGLHSQEKRAAYWATSTRSIIDRDVASYYPRLILNQYLCPPALGDVFPPMYEGIVNERLGYKDKGIAVWANGLKIVINGTFGKLFDPHSVMYYPEGGIQVTLTGQLSLLMLVDWLEYAGFHVVSANTDGLVTLVDNARKSEFDAIVEAWQKRTMLNTEETHYRALLSRDVNNYIAIKPDGSTKNKGAYANPWAGCKDGADMLHKNPVTTICIEAAIAKMTHGTPLLQTITSCKDITKFVCVKTANGGAVKIWDDHTEFLGKSLRWYYSTQVEGTLTLVKTGGKVSDSEFAKPCGRLPSSFPNDINYDVYVERAERILTDIAFN